MSWGHNHNGRRGAILVLVLAVLALLSLLAFGLCHRVRLELKRSRMQTEQTRARFLALGGLNRALAAIRADNDAAVDHLGEPWHLGATAASEGLLVSKENNGTQAAEAPACRLSYAVLDEEGRFNLNTSSPAAWAGLPGVDEALVYALVDWQDEDDCVTGSGAETPEYQRGVIPYRAKNRPITMIWELALVRGVSGARLLGEDVNGNSVLDAAEDDGAVTWPLDDADGVLDRGLADYFTVYGDGKLNLNTAAAEVLAALPDVGPVAGRAVVEWRNGPDGQPLTDDDRFLRSRDQVDEIPGLTEHQAAVLKECGTVTSSHFRICVEAAATPSSRPFRLMAVARREEDGVKLVWWRSLSGAT